MHRLALTGEDQLEYSAWCQTDQCVDAHGKTWCDSFECYHSWMPMLSMEYQFVDPMPMENTQDSFTECKSDVCVQTQEGYLCSPSPAYCAEKVADNFFYDRTDWCNSEACSNIFGSFHCSLDDCTRGIPPIMEGSMPAEKPQLNLTECTNECKSGEIFMTNTSCELMCYFREEAINWCATPQCSLVYNPQFCGSYCNYVKED